MSSGKTNIDITIIKTKILTTKFRLLWPLEMSRDCAITLLHENVTRYCIVGARIECAKIVVFVLIRAKVIIIIIIYVFIFTTSLLLLLISNTKVYYKTGIGTWRFRKALKKLKHNNANTTFIVICLIF